MKLKPLAKTQVMYINLQHIALLTHSFTIYALLIEIKTPCKLYLGMNLPHITLQFIPTHMQLMKLYTLLARAFKLDWVNIFNWLVAI